MKRQGRNRYADGRRLATMPEARPMTRMGGDGYNASGSPNEASAQAISRGSAAGYNARVSINEAPGAQSIQAGPRLLGRRDPG